MLRELLILFLLLSAFIVMKADTIPYTPTKEELRQMIIDSVRDRYDIEGLELFANEMSQKLNGAILIAVKDTVLVEHSYGELRLTSEPPHWYPSEGNAINDTTLFDLASVSKQFTAAAVLKLFQQGKIDLDDTITKYYPNLPYPDVTIRNLLTHTSGIPEYFKFKYTLFGSTPFIDNTLLIKVLETAKLKKIFPTGTRFEYINTNYAILAQLVEDVSGVPFEQFVHENIFAPAGMNNTFFFTEIVGIDAKTSKKFASVSPSSETVEAKPLSKFEGRVAIGHKYNLKLAKYDRMNGVLGDKGVYSNIEDMLRWANAYFIEYKVLPKELVELASQRENQLSTGTLPANIYGFGLRIEESPTHGKLVYHGGLWNGFQNLFLYRPSDNVIVIFLSNYYNRAHAGYSDRVLNIFDGIKEQETGE